MSEFRAPASGGLAVLAAAAALFAVTVTSANHAPRICGDTIMVVDGSQVGSDAERVVIGRPLARSAGSVALRSTQGPDGRQYEETGTYLGAEFYDLHGKPREYASGCIIVEDSDLVEEGVTVNIQLPLDDPSQTADGVRGMAARLGAPVSS